MLPIFCYNLDSKARGVFTFNLRAVVDYTLSVDFENGIKAEEGLKHNKEVELRQGTAKLVLKLYDHVVLASTQLDSLKKSDSELKAAVQKELAPFKDELTRDMSGQLISLVGIFTAVAFVVFGGFGALTDVFLNIANVPISKIVSMASVWGLIISNCIFVLMHYVKVLTSLKNIDALVPPISDDKRSILSILNMPHIVYWANSILITLLIIPSWLYYIDSRNLGGWMANVVEWCPPVFTIAGVLVGLAFFALCAWFFSKENNPVKDKKS